MVTQLTTTVFL